MNKINKYDLFALIAGAFLTLAFAPFGIFTFAVLSPAILLSLWINASPLRAFWRGWLFGMGFFGTGVYWVYISIHTYGNASELLSYFITVSFIAILAFFPALNGYLLNRFFSLPNFKKIILAFPATWVLLEWTRSWIFTGFAWLTLGDSQVNSPLKGYASLFSTYGVSLVTLLSSSLLLMAVINFRHQRTKQAYQFIFSCAVIWIIGGLLSFISWTKPLGSPLQVSLVQGNIPQELKWSSNQILPTLDHYTTLSKAHLNSNIIIWPEGAIPISLQNAAEFIETLSTIAKKNHTTIITGIPIKVTGTQNYYNAVIAIGEGGGIYLKRRLVPFGEYTPLPNLLDRLLNQFNIPMSDFIPGRRVLSPITTNGVKVATFICYEIAFAEQVLQSERESGFILTVSNDGWFGHSIALAQHLQTAQMRAVETGRPILFVANTGITAIISPDGNIQAAAPPYVTYVLTDKIQPREGQTPWQRFGLDPLLILLIGMLFFAKRRV